MNNVACTIVASIIWRGPQNGIMETPPHGSNWIWWIHSALGLVTSVSLDAPSVPTYFLRQALSWPPLEAKHHQWARSFHPFGKAYGRLGDGDGDGDGNERPFLECLTNA
jgi:hypothetical protein